MLGTLFRLGIIIFWRKGNLLVLIFISYLLDLVDLDSSFLWLPGNLCYVGLLLTMIYCRFDYEVDLFFYHHLSNWNISHSSYCSHTYWSHHPSTIWKLQWRNLTLLSLNYDISWNHKDVSVDIIFPNINNFHYEYVYYNLDQFWFLSFPTHTKFLLKDVLFYILG